MARFGESLSSEEIRKEIMTLLDHKVIREIDFLLSELKRREKEFQFKIFSEMVVIKNKPDAGKSSACGGIKAV